MNEKKFFAGDGKLDGDSAPFALAPNDWLNAENIRSQTTDAGVTETVESIGSNVLISPAQPSVTFITIGTIEDTENNRFIKFQYNTTGVEHKIICLYADTNTEYNVLLASNVTGGLNFSKNSPIHSAVIVNGYLIWPDGTNNQLRKVNIEAGIKGNHPSFVTSAVAYTYPLRFSEITLIKPPPPLPPQIAKTTDGTFLNNFIANESFEFAFQYIYYDNETTVTGVYSVASRLNSPTGTENEIVVTMNLLESIPDTVRIVNLVVRISNGNDAKVVKTWDKTITAEAAQIAAHNSGATALTYGFYNNITGQTLAQDDVLRPFDTVPIYSKTMAAARNRIFPADNTEGYNTPATTSLTLALGNQVTLANTSQSTILYQFFVSKSNGSPKWATSAWVIYMAFGSQVGYYAITSTLQYNYDGIFPPIYSPTPTTVALSGLTYLDNTLGGALQALRPAGFYTNFTNYSTTQTASTVTITGTSTTEYSIFAQKMPYKAGVVFYDFGMRKCGVVTNDGLVVTTPARDYAYSTAYTSLNWTLSNASATTEIPDWAYWYAPVRTLNLRTRFFIEAFTNAAKYASKDKDGKYVFTSNLFTISTVGIGLNTASINQAGLGYSFTDGDVCILTKSDNTIYQLPVIGLVDNYIIIKAQDLGDLSNVSFVFEVYTPYQTSDQEPFFEVGQLYSITNPTTSSREYSALFGSFNSDAYAISRNYLGTTYFAGAMSPNDLYYQRWDNDGGKPNYITKLGQVVKTGYIRWSDTFIPNTAVNGLSTFRALNQKNVPEDCGAISKLILTSKVQGEQGTVMLAICAGSQTASLYLGEVQITDSTGATQFFSSSDTVIGTINVLKGNYGTINPESVSEYRGNVYFFDAYNGKWIQYSVNGLDVISDYKMTRFWSLWAKQYLSMTAAQIEALGGRPFVFSVVDPHHKELLISIPKLSNTPPKGYLPDYPSTVYPFDALDFQGKTMVYKLDMPGKLPHWQGSYSFYTENFVTLNNKLYSFKNGLTYLHNQTSSSNNFYGIQYTSKVMCVSNMLPNVPKSYDNLSVQSNIVPLFVYMYNSYPIQQATDLVDTDFTDNGNNPMGLEGIWYSTIKRNKLQPTATGFTSTSLLTGEKMRNVAMLMMYEFATTTGFLELKFIQVGMALSKGHQNQLQK